VRRYRIQLLTHAGKRGLTSLLRQGSLLVRDALWSQNHLVFRIDASDLHRSPHYNVDGFTFGQIRSWEELCEATRQRLIEEKEGARGERVWWGEIEWFGRGWELWAGYLHRDLAALCWFRSASQSVDFFCEIPNGSVLIWQGATLPEFRGRRLISALIIGVMRVKAANGIRHFYGSCRDYNAPPRRYLPEMGFKQIGYTSINVYTKRRVWHPSAPN
jgi:hypothetical protein